MKRLFLLPLLAVIACGGKGSPTSPSPAPTPQPSLFNLTGHVSNSSNGTPVGGVNIRIVDGPDAGKSTSTNSGGDYAILGLRASAFSVSASANYYNGQSRAINFTGSQTLDFALEPIPLWTRSGSGNQVFDMPTTVSRVHIQGHWNGQGNSNFIVWVGRDLVVNEILRQTINYDGTHLVTGGVVRVEDSNYIAWTFTEIRP